MLLNHFNDATCANVLVNVLTTEYNNTSKQDLTKDNHNDFRLQDIGKILSEMC